jgi:hypothetical protein
MKKYLQLQLICAGLMLGGSLLLSGCTGVAYTGGVAAGYDYDYYPDWDIYYYPEGHIYYWNEGGAWRSGERLPDRYDLRERHSQRMHFRSQQPWRENPRGGHGDEHHDHD